MSIDKYSNQQYSGGVPLRVGDRRFSQDRVRDFWFHMDRLGLSIEDIYGMLPILLSGGVVTQGAGSSLDITAGYGYAKFSVTIPNSFASTPPSTSSADVEAVRVSWGAQNDINAASGNCSVYTVVDDGATVQYVKMRFLETDGNTRARAKATGTYSYEVTPDFDLVVDAVAPTDYDIVLATFTSSGGTYTITTYTANSLSYSSIQDISDKIDLNTLTITANYTITDTDKVNNILADTSNRSLEVDLPTANDNIGRIITISLIENGGSIRIVGDGSDEVLGFREADSVGSFYMFMQGDYCVLESIGSGLWILRSKSISIGSGWINQSDWTSVNLGMCYIAYNTASGSFTLGELITESTSGNTWRILDDTGTEFLCRAISGDGIATNGRTLTGSTSTETANVNGNSKNTFTGLGRTEWVGSMDRVRIELFITKSTTGSWSSHIKVPEQAVSGNIGYKPDLSWSGDVVSVITGSGGVAILDGFTYTVLTTQDYSFYIRAQLL